MVSDPFSLSGKHILITGASSGIGRATAVACSGKEAFLSLWARNETKLNQALSEMQGNGHKVKSLDVNDAIALRDGVDGIDKIDGLVLCAGTTKTCPTKYITHSDLEEIFETNLFSSIELIRLLQEKKKLNKNSSIVLISSVAGGIVAQNGNAMYSASKGALSAYGKVLALELAPRQIRVNSILPGMVKTDFLKNFTVDPEQFAEDEKKYPLGYGQADDVAYAAIYLLSDASRWMTGNNLIIDGGLTLQ